MPARPFEPFVGVYDCLMRLGIDLGGTKIEARVLDDRGRELGRRRVPTPAGDYEATVESVVEIVRIMERELGPVETIGIGTPGSIDPVTGLLRNSNSTALNNRPFDVDLTEALGREIRMANDADCFVVSEAADGAGRGADPVFAVILGTGVGGGIVANGKLLSGPNRIAGEWGHNRMPWPDAHETPGPSCYCGLSGCIETFLSGPGLERDHEAHAGARLGAAEIAAAAESGDGAALATMERYQDRLARALASVINVIDPEVIVLGGGVSNIKSLYTAVPERWVEFVFSANVLTRLEPAAHGDSSGVRGAAWLWQA